MGENENIKLNIGTIRRILVAAFCIFIGVCVSYVMFRVYVPNQNSLGALSSVCMDVVCMIILFILISSFAFESIVSTNRTTKLFVGLLLATIWAVFLDFLNWAFDGSLEFGHLTYWFTVGSLCMGAILACLFTIYLNCYMEEKHRLFKMRMPSVICAILNLISFGLSFILAVTGTAFQFVDGHYVTGVLYDLVTYIPVVTLLFLTGYVVFHVKKVGLHDVIAVAGYIFFMVAGALIESGYGIGTTYVAVAIADTFIFVMLQNDIIAQEKRNTLEWMKKSNTDVLTGFYNRYAYEADIKTYDDGVIADNFVYVSVDVNSLKMINDSHGHNAGDEMLIGAAECLKKCFGPYGKLYRIGGDECIALINTDEETLSKLKVEINELAGSWSGKLAESLTLSCGYVSRKEVGEISIKQISVLADQRMYEAKNDYYRRTGIERRKR